MKNLGRPPVGVDPTPLMLEYTEKHFVLVQAALQFAAVPSDAESEKIVGALRMSHLSVAATAHTADEWQALYDAAHSSIEGSDGSGSVTPELRTFLDKANPLMQVAHELLQRGQEQADEAMVDGITKAAQVTPGLTLTVDEIVNDRLVSRETHMGPEPGHEDSADMRIEFAPYAVQSLYGTDAASTQMEVERLMKRQRGLVLQRNHLGGVVDSRTVREAVAEAAANAARRNFKIAEIAGSLPTPIAALGTAHFADLQGQLLFIQHEFLTNGATASRVRRGDENAQVLMFQQIVLSDLTRTAQPHFLPRERIQEAAASDAKELPADTSFLVWHDDAVTAAGNQHIIAWLLLTNEAGELYRVAQAFALDGTAITTHWCNLDHGSIAPLASQVGQAIHADVWQRERRLSIREQAGSPAWRKKAQRSIKRVVAGALHEVNTLRNHT